MDMPSGKFVLAGSLEKSKEKARLVLHGGHRPILVIFDIPVPGYTHMGIMESPAVQERILSEAK
jgi:hypothetical protein